MVPSLRMVSEHRVNVFLAAQAAAQTPLRSGEAPYLRTLASIAAASVD